MTRTHAKATQHAGPVCGADDGPQTRVSDDPMLITCPDCPDLIWIEALPNDATSGDLTIIEALRDVRRGHMRKVDGLIVDATTANAILTVWDVMKPATRSKFLTLDLDRMAAMAWRVLDPKR